MSNKVEVSKPEVTEDYVHIPIHECKITATIPIDASAGIKATYCGGEKMIHTYLFSTDKWDMDRARKWVSEHSKAMSKAIETIKAEWDVADINNLPDSAFAYVRPGEKDGEGKTVPRTNRFLPYKGSDGKVDLPHLRNALARLPQTDLSAEEQAKARKVLEVAAKREGVGEPAEKQRVEKSYIVPIIKVDEEKRLVYGIVLEPNTVDAQKDYETEEEIEKACHAFMRESQKVYTNHKDLQKEVSVVENYIAPADFKLNEEQVKKGSWVMVTHCANDEVWGQVKKGEFTGYSIRGFANRQ